MENGENMDGTKKNILIFLIALVVVLSVGTSLSYLKGESGSTNNNNVSLASFSVDLIDDINSISINPMYPMTDAEGLSRNDNLVTFGIENKGLVSASYKVSLQDASHEVNERSTLLNSEVRYKLIKTLKNANNEVVTTESLDIDNLGDTGELDTGIIDSSYIILYELRLWQDYDSTVSNAYFNKIIVVESIQSSNLDKSGANFPELADNMIPVYYEASNETTGVWKKADSKNLNKSFQWFDYDNQMWANAVTVKESGTHTRDYYLNAENGTTIEMDDITTMWVWIPRYKYVIFNGNNETVEEQMINVEFEHGNETTGTVKCHDDILTDNNSSHSEICADTTNGSIVNHKSTYTHPAFCFGNKDENGNCDGEELTGFWMAKFEMSTDDATCNGTMNETNCNKTDLNILVKPDKKTLIYIDISSLFANIRRMETYGNIHGFKQSASATTWLDASGYLTGEINNDSNTLDTHMIKNMEWGAVAYLSQSKYGKQGNELYTGAYKEVYINNNSTSKTGYSGGSYDSAASSSATYLYNNLENYAIDDGRGYKGAGASTTGTVYGIYDMSGGRAEFTMTNSNNYNIQSSGFFEENIPIDKYYDKYNDDNNNVTKSKYGDAFGETVRWYNDLSSTDCGYFIVRGNSAGESTEAGIYAKTTKNGAAANYISSRPVLVISRTMPWQAS